MSDFLRFFSYHQPRRIRVIENTLRSQRTVATLFWAKQYDLLEWWGAGRFLTRHRYDHEINQLVSANLLTLDDQGQATLTPAGVSQLQAEAANQYEPSFYAWYWLANTHRVLQRLLLGVQVVSEYSYHQTKYIPLAIRYSEMMAVKQWFRQHYQQNIVKAVFDDLERFGSALVSEDQRLADDLFNLLIGHQQAGWTEEQARAAFNLSQINLQFMRHDEILAISAYVHSFPGPLQDLLLPLLNNSPLSRSAASTFDLYQRGQTISQIASQRRLKENTIREHLLEAAILIPDQLNWEELLPYEKREKLAKSYQGNPSSWRFDAQIASFFEYRLFQLFQGGEKNG